MTEEGTNGKISFVPSWDKQGRGILNPPGLFFWHFLKNNKKNIQKRSGAKAPPYPQIFANEKEELDFAVKKMERLGKGYEVYIHLSKNKILKKVGFYSARVIVLNLIPMYYSEQNAPIDHPRVKNISNINPALTFAQRFFDSSFQLTQSLPVIF